MKDTVTSTDRSAKTLHKLHIVWLWISV